MAKPDKYGNMYQSVPCTDDKNDNPVGWIEIKGQLYKIQPAPADSGQQDRKGRDITAWVRITQMSKRKRGNGKRGF